MLDRAFMTVLNMSWTACFVIAAVLLARLALKRAPRVFSYALWAVVLARLICPFSFSSVISLIPVNTQAVSPQIVYAQSPTVDTGIAAVDEAINGSLPQAQPENSINPIQVWLAVGQCAWVGGMALLVIFSAVSFLRLKRRLRGAQMVCRDVYVSKSIETPFVIGLISPRIYLPQGLTQEELPYILEHERTHIRRFDHVAKLVGYAAACVHWFNPLVWVAFYVCGRDMEASCDEAVIKKLGGDIKTKYSSSLLHLATGRRIISGTPLAFGEGDTKARVKNVLSYKKPALWVMIASAIAVAALAIGLLANPVQTKSAAQADDAPGVSQALAGHVGAGDRAAAFTVDVDGDNADEAGVLFDAPDGSASCEFYKSVGAQWTLFSTIGSLPGDAVTDIDVYRRPDGTALLHIEAIDDTQGTAMIYTDTYIDFAGESPTVSTPRRSLDDLGDGARWYGADGQTELSMAQYDALIGGITAGAQLEDTITLERDASLAGMATHMLSFPAYQAQGGQNDAEAFTAKISLPALWRVGDSFTGEASLLPASWTAFDIYDADNAYRGFIAFDTFEPYEDEIPQDQYYKTVYAPLRLGAHYSWNNYSPIAQGENGETALAQVYYQTDPGDGSAAAAWPQTIAQGIMCYDKELGVYVVAQFDGGDALEASLWRGIARSIGLSRP